MKIGLLVAAATGGVVGGAVVWLLQSGSFKLSPGSMTYEQLAATLLAASALIVTIIGIVVAVLALWGYREFQRTAEKKASKAAKRKVEAELQTGEIRQHIETIVVNFLQDGVASGTLISLVEQRRADASSLRRVDAGWGDEQEDEEIDRG